MRATETLSSLLITMCCAVSFAGRLPWPTPAPDWYTMESETDLGLGYVVSGLGDVNGDGYDDVYAGCSVIKEHHELGAFVYFGSSEGLPDEFSQRFQSLPRGGGAGDVNGDGFADMFTVSASGELHIYHGTQQGVSKNPAVVLKNEHIPNHSVSGVGDVNGDGFADCAGGRYSENCGGGKVSGCVKAVYGSSSGLSSTPDWTVAGKAGDRLGHHVYRAGDVNGDGFGDVIVLATGISFNNTTTKALVYHGSAAGLSTTAAWTKDFGTQGFLASASTAGDVNADGFDDIICDMQEKGCAVFPGSSSGLGKTAAWHHTVSDQYTVSSVGTIGDYNGDGFDDIGVGQNESVLVFYGSSGGPSPAPDLTITGNYPHGSFGISITSVGDVNGDGGDDFAIGAHHYLCAGMVFVYHGTPGKAPAKRGLRKAVSQKPLVTHVPGRLLLDTGVPTGKTVSIRVVDFMGNTVMNRTVQTTGSVHEFALPRTAHGTYAVSARVGDSWIRERITVVRKR